MTEIAKRPPEALFNLTSDQWTEPFWRAAKERRLTAAQCAGCGQFRMPPTPFCPECLSQQLNWPTLSGTGTLFSYTVVRKAITAEMESGIPYVPALVDLDGALGARLITTIVDVPIDSIQVGSQVRVVWNTRTDGVTIPCFTLTGRT